MPADARLKDLVSDEKYDACLKQVAAKLRDKGHPEPEKAAHAICVSTFQKQFGLKRQGEGLTFSGALARLLVSEAKDDPKATATAIAQLFKAQVTQAKSHQGRPTPADARPVVAALENKLRGATAAEDESTWGTWWGTQVDQAQRSTPGDQVQWALLTTARSLASRDLSSTSWAEAARSLLGRIRSMADQPTGSAIQQISNRDARS